ncbi:MAG: DUF2460 domain-containing protein, partial [Pseudomonadota bacterium]
MSSLILPSLIGLGFDVVRTPEWSTVIQTSVSGKETRIAKLSYPRWKWVLQYNILRSNANYTELQQLAGFFNKLNGQFDSFLYQDADDNNVSGQGIGTGDGIKTSFQLVRSFGGFAEPIFAPNIVSSIYINGVRQTSGFSVNYWGVANPGTIVFSSAPASGAVITADFSYYFPVRMTSDSAAFNMFISGHYKV